MVIRLCIVVSLLCACGGTVVVEADATSDAEQDGARDSEPTIDIGVMPAPFPDAPIPHTFPAEDGGSCATGATCYGIGDDVVCDPTSGWCCAGNWSGGECRCGEGRGCMPPYVCCRSRGEVIRQCKPFADCE